MTGKNTAVLGLFSDSIEVERVVDHLKTAGFSNNDVSVLMADKQSTRDFAHKKETKAPEGTAAGVTTGAVFGGALGWLAGIGALAIPGLGSLIAAGPIVGLLAGAGAGGAVGGLTGALIGLGIPEYEAKRFEGLIKDGRALVSVHCNSSDEVKKAKEVLEASGGKDISSRKEEGVDDDERQSFTASTAKRRDDHADGYRSDL